MSCAPRSVTDTLLVPLVRVLAYSQARQRSGTLASTPGLLGRPVRLFRVLDKETSGPPKFPGYPFELMPCSQTPVVPCTLALTHPGLLPSAPFTASAFPSKKTDGYPLSTIIQISRLNHTACFLAPPGFGLPLPGLPARFATDLLARLWSDGIFTHWVTLTNFYRHTPISHRSGLFLARERACWVWPG
jgi:hypothetical protein